MGSLLIDMVFGGYGFLCGRIIEIFGFELSGKMILVLYVIVEV